MRLVRAWWSWLGGGRQPRWLWIVLFVVVAPLVIGVLAPIVALRAGIARLDRNGRVPDPARWASASAIVLVVYLALGAATPATVPSGPATSPSPGLAEVAVPTGTPTAAPTPSALAVTPSVVYVPVTPEPATPEPATPKPTRTPTATPDVLRDAAVAAAVFQSQFGITFEDSPLSDGTVRKLGRDATGLVTVELTGDPLTSMSVSGPIPGSAMGTDNTIGNVLGAEAAAFGDPVGMTNWLFAQMKAAGSSSDREVSKRFGKVVAHLQWYAATLGMMTITLDHD